ncbi:MAG: TonB-dependent receptor [Runella sp.]
MRLSLVQFFLATTFIGLSWATETSAQELLNTRLTLQVENRDLKHILARIEREANIKFMYSAQVIPVNRKISINATNESLSKILDNLLNPLQVTYRIIDRTVLLKNNASGNSLAVELSPAANSIRSIDTRKVTGKVVDDNGEPLPGVSVLVKNTTLGTTTNAEGNYSIDVPQEATTLVFSSVGFVRQEVKISGNIINVRLTSDPRSLEEVVVVGYGTQKRSDLTGAIATVKGDEIKNMPVRSVNEALQGRMAGVQVTKGSGAPGAGADILIRGPGSINGMPPLYIVDGVRISGTGFNFNVQDIESIEVLKDASAAAIYGVDAAGGVILVTTKRGGKSAKPSVNLSSWYGIRQPTRMYSLLRRDQYAQARENFGFSVASAGNLSQLPDVDWIDEVFRNGGEQNYTLSVNGGGERSNYFISTNFQREDGIVINTFAQRFNVRINSDYQLAKRLKVGQSMYMWRGNFRNVDGSIPFRSTPLMPVFDPDNALGGWGRTPGGFYEGANPVGARQSQRIIDVRSAIEGNIFADWAIVNGLNFRTTLGASLINNRFQNFQEAFSYGTLRNPNATLSQNMFNQENYTANFTLTYGRTFGKHDLKAMAGYEAYREDGSRLEGTANGFTVPVATSFVLSSDPTNRLVNAGFANAPFRRLLSQFGRINYGYAGKYFLTANIRRDGTDRFATGRKWGTFSGFSAGWKMSEEAFMQNLTFISNLKLRGGYGVLGIANVDPFQYLEQFSFQNITGLPDGTRVQGFGRTLTLANSDLQWETVKQTDIGLDLGLFSNRINVNIDWYNRQSEDVLYRVPTPFSAGLSNITFVNVGSVRNRGLEIAIDYRGKIGNNLTYNVGGNVAFNRNKVLNLDGVRNAPFDEGRPGDVWRTSVARTAVNQPFGQFFGYIVDGIFPTEAAVRERNVTQTGAGAGDLIYRDLNGDGRITLDDRTFIGNPWPGAIYGITANIKWKQFDLNTVLTGVADVDIYNGVRSYTDFFVGDNNTTANIFETSFFGNNTLTDKPRTGVFVTNAQGQRVYTRDPNSNYGNVSSYFVERGGYLRLTNLQLGYSLPTALLNKAKISGVRMFVMGQNLFTITPYSGLDPEISSLSTRNGAAAATSRGIDDFRAFPRTRMFSIGLEATF